MKRWKALDEEERRLRGRADIGESENPAAAALRAWRGVGRAARSALKSANPHSVLELEMQIVEVVERVRGGGGSGAG